MASAAASPAFIAPGCSLGSAGPRQFVALAAPAPAFESPWPAPWPEAARAPHHREGSASWILATALAGLAGLGRRRKLLRGRAQKTRSFFPSVASASLLQVDGKDLLASKFRREFPALNQEVRPGVPLVYLDNAATSQKPRRVLAEMQRFYSHDNSNVHRGMHTLAIRSTEAFEQARAKVAAFINASDAAEVVFTRNATEALNLVAHSWARAHLREGDEIILTVMEHHSNIVPWHLLANEIPVKLRFVNLTPEGTFDKEDFLRVLNNRTRLVSLCHVSNVLGCVNPIEWVASRAHDIGATVVVDACQSVPHGVVDVQRLGADFVVASGHKMCAPTGIGFLWGKKDKLRECRPFLGGGEMIDEVTLEGSTYADIPHRLEAGTPAYAEAIALGAACDFLAEIGMPLIRRAEQHLVEHLWRRLSALPGARLYGPSPLEAPDRSALVSFNVDGCHPHDLATIVDQEHGVAMRAGHHCCQPLHRHLGVSASARLSAYFYNTIDEIDTAVDALTDAITLLRGTSAAQQTL